MKKFLFVFFFFISYSLFAQSNEIYGKYNIDNIQCIPYQNILVSLDGNIYLFNDEICTQVKYTIINEHTIQIGSLLYEFKIYYKEDKKYVEFIPLFGELDYSSIICIR